MIMLAIKELAKYCSETARCTTNKGRSVWASCFWVQAYCGEEFDNSEEFCWKRSGGVYRQRLKYSRWKSEVIEKGLFSSKVRVFD